MVSSASENSDPLFHQSLTPVNVIKKIREDILIFLGCFGRESMETSELEQRLVDALELILRKGQCPSLIHEDPELTRIFEALTKAFAAEQVMLEEDGEWLNFAVFETLLYHARQAHAQKMREDMLKSVLPSPEHAIQHHAVQTEIDSLRNQRASRALVYQRLIFNHASQLRQQEPPRVLMREGKPIHIEDLLADA